MILDLKKFSNILQSSISYVQLIHKLYNKSKSSKTKLTVLHYISDKNHNDSKFCQKVVILQV